MKLAAKFVMTFVVAAILLLILDAYFAFQSEVERFEQDVKRDHMLLGYVMRELIVQDWQGEVHAMQLASQFNTRLKHTSARWVWLDANDGTTYDPRALPYNYDLKPNDPQFVKALDQTGQEAVFAYVHVEEGTARPGAIELSEPIRQPTGAARMYALRVFLLSGVAVLLGAIVLVVLGIEMVGRPLRRLIEKARRIGEGDFSDPLVLGRRDEFGELADALNSMCDQLVEAHDKATRETAARIAALEQLRHADRLRTVGRLASGMAHEVGTPLNVVSGRAGLIASGKLSTEEARQSAQAIKTEAERIATIIRQLLDFARRSTPQKKSMDLRQVVRETVELLDPLVQKREAMVALTGEDTALPAVVDGGQIQQMLTNLIVNALQSRPTGIHVDVAISRQRVRPPDDREAPEGDYYCIAVRDDGRGIPGEHLDQLFEPFFTTKDVGEGTGLGLSISYGIVQEHGGWIDVQSEVGRGSCFLVYLPVEAVACADES